MTWGELTPPLVMFLVASLTGLATIVRSRRELTRRSITGAMLYNGLLGLAVGAIWIGYFPEKSMWLPLGVSILVGLSNSFDPSTIVAVLLRAFNLRVDNDKGD